MTTKELLKMQEEVKFEMLADTLMRAMNAEERVAQLTKIIEDQQKVKVEK